MSSPPGHKYIKDDAVYNVLSPSPPAASGIFPRQPELTWDENHLSPQAQGFTLCEKLVFSWAILETINASKASRNESCRVKREDLKQWISNAESMGTTFGQITLALYYIGGSQRAYFVLQGTFSDVWGYFWLSCWGMGNATGIYWPESRETAKHHTRYRTAPAPTVKNYLDQAVYSATVKETLH